MSNGPVEMLVIRHAPTPWNAQKRLQGRCDIELDANGLATLQGLRLPPEFLDVPWYCSPLQRARQTAAALGVEPVCATSALTEMDWGQWEGEVLPALRQRLGEWMQRQEAQGLDLQPPGGESPRQVRQRLLAWLQQTPFDSPRIGLITHKGVIRALLSAALAWEMRTPCPVRIDWRQARRFRWADGRLSLLEANRPLNGL